MGRGAYNDSGRADELSDHSGGVAFSCSALGDIVHCLCHNDDAFAQNDEREQAHPFVQIGPLEADFAPLARAGEDDECFHGSQDIPDQVCGRILRVVEGECQTEADGS